MQKFIGSYGQSLNISASLAIIRGAFGKEKEKQNFD
jgi:hypothetical protein